MISIHRRLLLQGVIIITLTTTYIQGHAKSFNRCELSRELLRYNFPRTYISNWVCLIEHESGRNTEKVTNHNNGHTTYGLFQISSKDWCRKGKKGGYCNMKCEDLLNVDLADDVRCAKRVFEKHGFQGWPASATKCRGKSLPDLTRC